MFRVSSPRRLDVMILSLCLLGALAILLLSSWDGRFFVENGPDEMLQVGALLAAALLFARASGSLKGAPGRLALALSLASLFFMVRELPRCGSPFYLAGPCMPGDTKTFAYLLPLPLALVLLSRNRALLPRWGRLRDALPSVRFVLRTMPLALVVALLAVGQFADGRGLPALEEGSELLAYALLALAGLAAAQAGDRSGTGSPGLAPSPLWSTT